MAKKGLPVSTQMETRMPRVDGMTHVGKYPVTTRVHLGESKQPLTPTQTAGGSVGETRPGQRQYAKGRTRT